MNDEQINHMVSRFLAWRLPEHFNPDAGISFKPDYNEQTDFPMKHVPTGKNLFDAGQAEAMVRYLVDGLPIAAIPPQHKEQAWSAVDAETWDMNRNEVLLWNAKWIDEDFEPTGIRIGYFQEEVRSPSGIGFFTVSVFIPDQDGYTERHLEDPADWPTHWRPHVAPPNKTSAQPCARTTPAAPAAPGAEALDDDAQDMADEPFLEGVAEDDPAWQNACPKCDAKPGEECTSLVSGCCPDGMHAERATAPLANLPAAQEGG